ncbi:hypothetical protein CcI49_05790 [Frankia sp. CcI49]|uniref:tetratricopeptide repeat protein n=1 Tax=Frankia sp. CcI49 TaxID=1745382 RepID=UPI00097842A2|nr:hypothetical protein [Frankia sp. CcI49]ONH61699.1 hypothetical protein CcI49_05790 [Frankia sp. CcI49]
MPQAKPTPAPAPAPAERSHDPVAVALANAALLGGGYLMLGRRNLAVVTTLVTAELLIIFASSAQVLWFALVLLGWWLALVAHGWYLAGGWPRGRRHEASPDGSGPQPRPGGPRPRRSWRLRSVAFGAALPVLLTAVFLRLDVERIDNDVDKGRQASDCGRVEAALDRVSPAHRMVAISPGSDGEDMVTACATLHLTAAKLTTGRTPGSSSVEMLEAGFEELVSIRAQSPDYQGMVQTTVDQFFDGLPTRDPCVTVRVLDWLATDLPDKQSAGRAADVVRRLAPEALLDCGDDTVAQDRAGARTTYQTLIDRYPNHQLAGQAREKVAQIDQAIALENLQRNLDQVRASLVPQSSGSLPAYCSSPAPYLTARTGGPGRAMLFGASDYVDKLPGEWRTTDVNDATRVICAGDAEYGAAVRTCPYENVGNVTFHREAVPVRVYDLRTGQLISDTRVEISGSSCPYFIYGYGTEKFVTPSDGDVQAAFRPLISP